MYLAIHIEILNKPNKITGKNGYARTRIAVPVPSRVYPTLPVNAGTGIPTDLYWLPIHAYGLSLNRF